VTASKSNYFTLIDACENLSKAGVTVEEEDPYILVDDSDGFLKPEWKRLDWDERVDFKKGSVIVIKLGNAETPFDN
jgi:hypothetical protein